ncbi:MAG: hypothetical protein AABY32_01600 [Nanoarchaeota archaeon]
MNKSDFLGLVSSSVDNNPDWVKDIMSAISLAITDKYEKEMNKKAIADVAICHLMNEKINSEKINAWGRRVIVKAINDGSFGGTEWATEIIEKLTKKE